MISFKLEKFMWFQISYYHYNIIITTLYSFVKFEFLYAINRIKDKLLFHSFFIL